MENEETQPPPPAPEPERVTFHQIFDATGAELTDEHGELLPPPDPDFWQDRRCPLPGVAFVPKETSIMRAGKLQGDGKGVTAEARPEIGTIWPACMGPACMLFRDGDCLIAGAYAAHIIGMSQLIVLLEARTT